MSKFPPASDTLKGDIVFDWTGVPQNFLDDFNGFPWGTEQAEESIKGAVAQAFVAPPSISPTINTATTNYTTAFTEALSNPVEIPQAQDDTWYKKNNMRNTSSICNWIRFGYNNYSCRNPNQRSL